MPDAPDGFQWPRWNGAHADPRAQRLIGEDSDWRLLLQVASDDDAGMMWGDMGYLYFWIGSGALRTNSFDQAWMILQCS